MILLCYFRMSTQAVSQQQHLAPFLSTLLDNLKMMGSLSKGLACWFVKEMSSRNAVFAQIFIADALKRPNTLLDKRKITQTHLYIDDRLGPEPRDRCAADVLDVFDLVTHHRQQARLFLLKERGPLRIVLDNDDLIGHGCSSLVPTSSVLHSPASDWMLLFGYLLLSFIMQKEEVGSIVAESVVLVQMGKTRVSPTP